MNTAQLVRLCLEHHRRHGVPFMTAWTRALQTIPRGTNEMTQRDRREWVQALRWARPDFEAAYVRMDLPATVRAERRALTQPPAAELEQIAS